jgi:hypothetical protein
VEAEERWEKKPLSDRFDEWYPPEKEVLEEDPKLKAKLSFG